MDEQTPIQISEVLAHLLNHILSSSTALCTHVHLLQVEVHKEAITPKNALPLVSQYDVVLDCTDNAPTRYLISDACVVAGKPLVSGAAIGTDGQLTVYNHGEDGEHCKSPWYCISQQHALAKVACCGHNSISSSYKPDCLIYIFLFYVGC